MHMLSNKNKKIKNMTFFLIAIIFGSGLIVANAVSIVPSNSSSNSNQLMWKVYAQMTPPDNISNSTSSSNTLIGDIVLLSTNDTATTTSPNATGANATGIQKNRLAQNVTSATAFTKENSTTPISPTGISTQSERAPPSNRIVNNTISTTNATNKNTTMGGTPVSTMSDINVTNEAATSSNVSQPATTNKPLLPIQQQQVGNQTDQSVNTSSLPQPPPTSIPSEANQSGSGTITNQSQQQNQTSKQEQNDTKLSSNQSKQGQQGENPLSKIPILGELFGGK
jgi:hypothetical protein